MKKINLIVLVFLSLGILFSCSDNNETHFISDAQQRADVENDLQERMSLLPNGDLFSILDDEMHLYEKEALQFLYAYMPLSDVTDYSGEYYLNNIRAAYKAKEEMPWGKEIPEREFNHFVLPVRINNENLDDSRFVFYDELKDRVKDLSLNDAVLEINHWCHEKANYKGSDSRTSSPLATVKTSWGRCGEESTFLVAALRAMCIPARQVYTPRWAHCDDNHAWVEAYVDGEWHFLGACEPEPVLDLGWFNAPASRCLLLHTRVFGRYYGPEEVIERTANHTEINVVYNYALTSKMTVKVVDNKGNIVPNAKVQFKIYNYAEFNTVAVKYTDENGETWMTAGNGDMLVYASKDGKFGFQEMPFGKTNQVVITLDKENGSEMIVEYDITPPAENAKMPEVTAEMRAENDRRFAYEDSLRNAYIASFPRDIDDKEILTLIEKSWGNYQTILDFIAYAENINKRQIAINLLKQISDKDLRDVTMDVLVDNLDYSVDGEGDIYNAYILNPRVSNEMIRPYKKTLSAYFDKTQIEKFNDNPQDLVEWVSDNISVNNKMNVRNIPMLPTSVVKSMVTDARSRGIFFVSMARSLGIASRIDPVTAKVQYMKDNQWIDVNFEAVETDIVPTQQGSLMAKYTPSSALTDLRYYTHFSIKKFDGENFNLLAYDAKDPGMDVGEQYSTLFENGLSLDPGYYVMTTGTRLSDGSSLTRMTFFNIESGKTTDIDLVMREPEKGLRIIGNFNSENRYMPVNETEDKSLLQTSGRGFYVLGLLDGGSEPTTHAMQDIALVKEELDKWGRSFIFLFQNEEHKKNFELKNFQGLPQNTTFGIEDGSMLNEIVKGMRLQNKNLPIFIIANTQNEIVFISQGYTIGLGEQLTKIINEI
ncbi:MAG: transglutaminase domain-containing protein [Lentimicrobiaceae bacterium]|nr:transglutaminase domain-containing protein [Lentimicrobiaceae bacterium]